ncbi:MAG: LysR family transcriptional regulator [Pseudomonadota bacterium]
MALTFRAMTYFTTALRRGNIARAADELHIAASAVSAAIGQIERQFDLTLVTRQRSRGIQPTASGRALAAKFERLLDEYQAVVSEAVDLKQGLSGDLRIGYYAPVAPAFLPKIISGFTPGHPGVTLHLEACDNEAAQAGLLAGDFDAILFVSEGARATIDYDVLVEAPAYCLVPAGHALAGRSSVTLDDVAREPIIALNRPFAAEYYRALFERLGTVPRIAAEANSTEMVRSLVGAGQGCAVLNMLPMTEVSYAGDRLAAVPLTTPLPPLSLAIGYTKSGTRRLVQHFVDACHTHFAHPGEGRCIVEL